MTAGLAHPELLGPAPDCCDAGALGVALGFAHDALVTIGHGWEPDRERDQLRAARQAGRPLLSVRLFPDEIVVGPLWAPGLGDAATCAGCAEHHQRVLTQHPLVSRLDIAPPPAPPMPFLAELFAAVVALLGRSPLAAGEAMVAGVQGVRRHRVSPGVDCPLLCGTTVPGTSELRELPRVALDDVDVSRGQRGRTLLAPGWLRSQTVDQRFGQVGGLMREVRAPFAMSMAWMPDTLALGYGRTRAFPMADATAVLEAYERLAGFPHEAPVLVDVAWHEIADAALDPRRLGTYTAEQLLRPERVMTGFEPDLPTDWVRGTRLSDGEPVWVPAEIGFYQYDLRYRRDRWAAREGRDGTRRHVFHETSSGCALGGSTTEAAIHSLLELAERDAFLLSWLSARPLRTIDPRSVQDPTSRALLRSLTSRGFEPHLLRATQDIDVPVVWALAVNAKGAFPATHSAAGSGLDPEKAVAAALWELVQVTSDPVTWTPEDVAPMLEDPWLVATMDDHHQLHTHPATLERISMMLGGPTESLADAFPGFPDSLRGATDLRQVLAEVEARFAAAGLDEIVLVDQTVRPHRALEVAVVKAVVPGIAPMCFGQANQRLSGLPRVTNAVASGLRPTSSAPFEPHPFP